MSLRTKSTKTIADKRANAGRRIRNSSDDKQTFATFPLRRLTLAEAIKMQFKLVDCIHQVFDGRDVVQDGDYGYSLRPEIGRPLFTLKVEQVLEAFFASPRVALVRGGGTNALRATIMAAIRPGNRVLVHAAPLYPTTAATLEAMAAELIVVDFNDIQAVERAIAGGVDLLHMQHTRHLLADKYDIAELIGVAQNSASPPAILIDDSYAVCRAPAIGAQLGADISAFSFFKLLGPGTGCVVAGTARGSALIDKVRKLNRSGGQRVPGPEAMEVLRGLVLAPVALAIQGGVVDEVVARLSSGECQGVRAAYAANCNSYAIFVELDEPVGPKLLEFAATLGAQRQVVGSESRIEMTALFHETFHYFPAGADSRIGGDPHRWIRINPHRAGPDTILRVLSTALRQSLDRSPDKL